MNIEQKIINGAKNYMKMYVNITDDKKRTVSPQTIKKWANKDFTEGAKWMHEQYQSEFGLAQQHHADQLAEALREVKSFLLNTTAGLSHPMHPARMVESIEKSLPKMAAKLQTALTNYEQGKVDQAPISVRCTSGETSRKQNRANLL